MSLARIKHTTRAQAPRAGKPPLKCQRCGNPIQVSRLAEDGKTHLPGEPYIYWYKGFRSTFKNVRCTTCPLPRTSELESSNKAEAYAAIEAGEDALAEMHGSLGESADIEQIVVEAGSAIREVAEPYREADEAFGGNGSTVSGEIADELEGAADDLEGFTLAGDVNPEPCSEHLALGDLQDDAANTESDRNACEACQELRTEWWDGLVEEAETAASF